MPNIQYRSSKGTQPTEQNLPRLHFCALRFGCQRYFYSMFSSYTIESSICSPRSPTICLATKYRDYWEQNMTLCIECCSLRLLCKCWSYLSGHAFCILSLDSFPLIVTMSQSQAAYVSINDKAVHYARIPLRCHISIEA